MNGRRGNGGGGNTSGGNGNGDPPQFEDLTSPYYLHPSVNPTLQLVSQPLIGSNYTNWSRSVITALIAKNKLQFVNEVLPRPDDGDLLFSSWICWKSMVVSWLRNSFTSDLF